MPIKSSILSFFLVVITVLGFAQNDSIKQKQIADSINSKYLTFYYDGDPFDTGDPEVGDQGPRKTKKPKKNVFYGIKCKKGYVIDGFGRSRSIEQFRYLKNYEEPSIYAKYIYWYDKVDRKIHHGNLGQLEKVKDHVYLLHGPYELSKDTNVIERGMFYKGTKDGRWEYYGPSRNHKFRLGVDTIEPIEISYQELRKKEHWRRGLPASAKRVFFDPQRKMMKELVPYDEDGLLNGYYVKFFKDGHKEEYGYYKNDKKIGQWYTYQITNGRYRKKKIMKYPKDPESEEKPEVVKEWNEEGKVIMEHDKKVDPNSKGRRH